MKKIVILLVLGLILITGCSKDDSMRLESISMKQVYDISENIEKYPDYVIVDVLSNLIIIFAPSNYVLVK